MAAKKAAKKKAAPKVAATVVIHRAAEMTPEGRKKVAQWLRSRAAYLEKHSDLIGPRFTQRYLYD